MIIGVAGSAGGRKCGERCRKTGTGAPATASARKVEHTPPRGPAVGAAVADHRDGQLDLVRADQRAGGDRVLPRGAAAPAPPATRSGSARTPNSATTSSALRPASHLRARPVAGPQQRLAAARSGLVGDEAQQVRRDPADVVGRDSASRRLTSAPSTTTDSVRGEPGRRQPVVHHEVGVGDDHAEGVADRVVDAVLARCRSRTGAPPWPTGRREPPVAAQPRDDGVRTGERLRPADAVGPERLAGAPTRSTTRSAHCAIGASS